MRLLTRDESERDIIIVIIVFIGLMMAHVLQTCRWSQVYPAEVQMNITITRSPAVARMADHTAPVVKLTLTLILPGHNLGKNRHFPLKRAHYEAK